MTPVKKILVVGAEVHFDDFAGKRHFICRCGDMDTSRQVALALAAWHNVGMEEVDGD